MQFDGAGNQRRSAPGSLEAQSSQRSDRPQTWIFLGEEAPSEQVMLHTERIGQFVAAESLMVVAGS